MTDRDLLVGVIIFNFLSSVCWGIVVYLVVRNQSFLKARYEELMLRYREAMIDRQKLHEKLVAKGII